MKKQQVISKEDHQITEAKSDEEVDAFGADTEEAANYQSLCGVVVIGAPGTGKTTFCKAMQDFLGQLERKHAIVNLDPANDNMEYKVTFISYF